MLYQLSYEATWRRRKDSNSQIPGSKPRAIPVGVCMVPPDGVEPPWPASGHPDLQSSALPLSYEGKVAQVERLELSNPWFALKGHSRWHLQVWLLAWDSNPQSPG
jgi:hypothetical protein